MASNKTNNALVLFAHKIDTPKGFVQLLKVDKESKPPVYTSNAIVNKGLQQQFAHLPQEALKAFASFGDDNMDKAVSEIKQRYNLQKSPLPFQQFQQQQLVKYYYDRLLDAKPFIPLIKWYHTRELLDKKRWLTAPCSISNYRPQLSFEVDNRDDGYYLTTWVNINGTPFALDSFTRKYFLLESGNEYFMLYFGDYQTLEWLRQQQPEQYAYNPADLIQYILLELEGKYPVKRNSLQTENTVTAEPVGQVVLSELSGAFLMLTPKWSYDGYIMEGAWQPVTELSEKGQLVTINRNETQEKQLLDLLEGLHPKFPDQKNGYYYLSFAEAQKKQWFLKAYHKLLTSGIDLLGMDMLKHFRYSTHKAVTTMEQLEATEQFIRIKFVLQFGTETVPLNELQKILLAGQRAVLLKDGSLGVLGDDWHKQYATFIKHGKVNKQELTIASWLAIPLQDGDNLSLQPAINYTNWWKRWQAWLTGETVYTAPAAIQANLRSYQQKGYEWMRLLSDAGAGGCLADDMGLGKTLQTICFIASIIEANPLQQHIIVCPASLVYNWEQEFKKFLPDVNLSVHHGAQRNDAVLQDKNVQVYITSYGTLRSDIEKLKALQFGVMIIDESHNIKNPSAQITRAVGEIWSTYCFALSGTPVVNNTFDLYAQLNTVLPGMFGNREFFKKEYADPIDRFGDEEKMQYLQKIIAPFVLRRTKEQVATDLPEKTETVLWCEMSNSQRDMYESIKEQIRGNIFTDIQQKGVGQAKLAVIQGILKLRQVCNSPLLLPEEDRTASESIKMQVLFEELDNLLAKHKVLVFSQFTSMLNLIAAQAQKKQLKYYHFDGQTPAEKRMEMVNAFQQEGNDTNLFLISLKAGNAGITLTAADYVFLFDPWWNEAVQQQAIDRTHRIGQTKSVFAYKMICKDSIEEKIIQLQSKKKKLSADLISTDDGFIQNLSEEDIAYLFA